MDESDAACTRLRDLEQTLRGVRDRLADLALLAAGHAPAGAPPTGAALHLVDQAPEGAPSPVLLPADELCTPALPEALVLPPGVDAPAVVVPSEAEPAEAVRGDAVSLR